MDRRLVTLRTAVIVFGCLGGALSLGQNQNPNPNPRQQALEQFQAKVDKTPIDFWGKVIDQSGAPVEGAKVTITLSSNILAEEGDSPKIIILSDANGLFSLTGKTGLGITVWVSKDGYYSVSAQSAASLTYFPRKSFNRAGAWESFPTQQQPTIFTLNKKGQPAANLIYKYVRVPIPKDGTPVDIDLAQGRAVPAGQGDLQVQTWVTDNGTDVVHPFPWKCLVKVIGGGLRPRAGILDFQAPLSGYQPQEQVSMSRDAEHWDKGMRKQYFLQLRGNRYARMRFEMIHGGANLLNLRYFLNPAPGDANLESAQWSAAD
jgi:hypothetical protein